MDDSALALLEVGRLLQADGYRFVAVTPETHRRVNARASDRGEVLARDLRDVFGWNRVFDPELLPRPMLEALQRGGHLGVVGTRLRSCVRFASLAGKLFVHSAFPTDEVDVVFFGPDTYRFHAVIERWAKPCRRLIDVGCGSGAGAITQAHRSQTRVLVDINPRALQLAEVNAALNAVEVELVASDVLAQVTGTADLIIANPPYMRDVAGRTYRDGGGSFGEALGVRIVDEALARLDPDGQLILYTGSAIVEGADTFLRSVLPILRKHEVRFEYEELDPDVFGEELERSPYSEVERISVVGLRVHGHDHPPGAAQQSLT